MSPINWSKTDFSSVFFCPRFSYSRLVYPLILQTPFKPKESFTSSMMLIHTTVSKQPFSLVLPYQSNLLLSLFLQDSAENEVDRNKCCTLCNMFFTSAIVAQSHYQGKTHAKRVRLVLGEQPSLPTPTGQINKNYVCSS